MEEKKITMDSKTYSLTLPFFVIATQNPNQHSGTYPLPESQLDRFLMKIELGYPSREAEKKILVGVNREKLIEELPVLFDTNQILQMQKEVREVFVSEPIVDYVQDLVERTRQSSQSWAGLSPRAATHLMRASKAWAYVHGRDKVLPEDVQAISVAVMSHRLNPNSATGLLNGRQLAETIINSTPVR